MFERPHGRTKRRHPSRGSWARRVTRPRLNRRSPPVDPRDPRSSSLQTHQQRRSPRSSERVWSITGSQYAPKDHITMEGCSEKAIMSLSRPSPSNSDPRPR
eukprot:4352108-Pyramimonas_sp.AAC.1